MDSPEQKFFVSDDGKEKLSITKAELQAGIDSGKHAEKTLGWTKGMNEWLPLSDPSWEKHGIVLDPEPPELPPSAKKDTPSVKASSEKLDPPASPAPADRPASISQPPKKPKKRKALIGLAGIAALGVLGLGVYLILQAFSDSDEVNLVDDIVFVNGKATLAGQPFTGKASRNLPYVSISNLENTRIDELIKDDNQKVKELHVYEDGLLVRRSFSDGPGGSFSTISYDKETRRATSSESSFEGETFEVHSGGSGVLVEDRGHPIPVVLGYTDGRLDMNRVQSLIKRMLGDFMRRNDTYPGRIKSFGEVTENLLQIQYLPNDINQGPSSSNADRIVAKPKEFNKPKVIAKEKPNSVTLSTPNINSSSGKTLRLVATGPIDRIIISDDGVTPKKYHQFRNVQVGWQKYIPIKGPVRGFASRREYLALWVKGGIIEDLRGTGPGTFSCDGQIINLERMRDSIIDIDSLKETDQHEQVWNRYAQRIGYSAIFSKNGVPFSGWAGKRSEYGRENLVQYREGRVRRKSNWHSNGHVDESSLILEDGSGRFVEFHDNGMIRLLYNARRGGLMHGPWLGWKGSLKVGMHKDGKRHGVETHWSKSGSKLRVRNFIDDKEDGLAVYWHENGQKSREKNYKDDKLMSAMSWKPNGEKCSVTNVKDGNGILVSYNEDGTEDFRATFKDGERVRD